jgi:hypothetical protein
MESSKISFSVFSEEKFILSIDDWDVRYYYFVVFYNLN